MSRTAAGEVSSTVRGFSAYSVHRMFFVPGDGVTDAAAAAAMYMSTTVVADTAAQHLGRWWELPEAARARAALDDALSASAAPECGIVDDLLHFVSKGATLRVNAEGYRESTTLRRRTAFVSGEQGSDALPLPLPLQRAENPPRVAHEWRELDPSQKPSALLLTHRFSDAPQRGATLVLCTLFLEDRVFEISPEAMKREVFLGASGGGGAARAAPPALWQPESSEQGKRLLHNHPTTDVIVNGATLSSADLAALPKAHRKAIVVARRAQLLAALRDCLVAARWPGGFLALRHLAAELLGVQARLWTEPLAEHLILRRTGGVPTHEVLYSRDLLMEAHTIAQRYAAAAALVRANLEAHAAVRSEEELLRYNGLFVWYRLGVFESEAGNAAAAIAAYRRGLEVLDALPADAWTTSLEDDRIPYELRHMHLKLLSAIVCASDAGGIPQDGAVIMRMYDEDAGFRAANQAQLGHPMHKVIFRRQRACFNATVLPCERTFAMTAGNGTCGIVEVPKGTPLPAGDEEEPPCGDPLQFDRCLPAMARGACAACGATPRQLKLCAACSMVTYCGARARMLMLARMQAAQAAHSPDGL
jgi:hypothetical protein